MKISFQDALWSPLEIGSNILALGLPAHVRPYSSRSQCLRYKLYQGCTRRATRKVSGPRSPRPQPTLTRAPVAWFSTLPAALSPHSSYYSMWYCTSNHNSTLSSQSLSTPPFGSFGLRYASTSPSASPVFSRYSTPCAQNGLKTSGYTVRIRNLRLLSQSSQCKK